MHPKRILALLTATVLAPGCFSSEKTPLGGQRIQFRATHVDIVVQGSASSCSAAAQPRKTVVAGRSALLGEYTGTSVVCSVYTSPVAGEFESARLVLRTADGDEISFVSDEARSGRFTIAADAQSATPTLSLEIAYSVAGGTGSFLGATGTATLRATGSLLDMTLQSTLQGTISVPIG